MKDLTIAVIIYVLTIVTYSVGVDVAVTDQETQFSLKAQRSVGENSGSGINTIRVSTSVPNYQHVTPIAKTHEYNNVQKNTIYGQQPIQQTTGYLVALNLNSHSQNQISATGQPQYVMQYLPQNTQQAANGYQYFQIVQTQPIVFPNGLMMSTVPPQYYNYQSNGAEVVGQSIHGVTQQHPIQHFIQPRVQASFNSYNFPTHQPQDSINPRNSLSFLPSKQVFNGLTGQVAQGINLNTNEYLPPQTESGFRAIKARQIKV